MAGGYHPSSTADSKTITVATGVARVLFTFSWLVACGPMAMVIKAIMCFR